MSTRRAPRADAMRPSLKKLSLGRLSLQAMATGAFIDDPELQDATDVFARIWSKAADYTNMTAQQKVFSTCQTLAIVRRIQTDFVPPSFYMHYAVLIGIPGAAQWKETIYSGKTNEQVAAMQALPKETRDELQRKLTKEQSDLLDAWCQKVRSVEAVRAATMSALDVIYEPNHPLANAEVVWLSGLLGAGDKMVVLNKFLRVVAPRPHGPHDPVTPWVQAADGTIPAERDWFAMIEGMGRGHAAQGILAGEMRPDLEVQSVYYTAVRSGNVQAMRLVQRSFANALNSTKRRRVAYGVLGGRMAVVQELIEQERLRANEGLGLEDDHEWYMLKLFRTLAESLALDFDRDPSNTGTAAQDIATLAAYPEAATSALCRQQILLGVTIGRRTEHDIPYYVGQYYDPAAMPDDDLKETLQTLLGQRWPSMQSLFREASPAKFRAFVQAIGPANVALRSRSSLLSLAAGTRRPSLQIDYGTASTYDTAKIHTVLDAFESPEVPAPYTRGTLQNAIQKAFYGYGQGQELQHEVSSGDANLQESFFAEVFNQHIQIVDRLFPMFPGDSQHANRFASTHLACGRALWSLYAHIAPYTVPVHGRRIDYQARDLRDVLVRVTSVFGAHGMTLGTRPEDAIDNELNLGWSETGRLAQAVQDRLTEGETTLTSWRNVEFGGPPPGNPDALPRLEETVEYIRQIRAALPAHFVLHV